MISWISRDDPKENLFNAIKFLKIETLKMESMLHTLHIPNVQKRLLIFPFFPPTLDALIPCRVRVSVKR
jgi:hypothetical protein